MYNVLTEALLSFTSKNRWGIWKCRFQSSIINLIYRIFYLFLDINKGQVEKDTSLSKSMRYPTSKVARDTSLSKRKRYPTSKRYITVSKRCRFSVVARKTYFEHWFFCFSFAASGRIRHVLYTRLWIEKTNVLVDNETDISRNLKGLGATEIANAVRKKKSRRGRDRYSVFRDPTPPRTRSRSLIANR
jgi:hypothetical protein